MAYDKKEMRDEFGWRLKRLMIDKGLSQSELARLANAKASGEHKIRRDTINSYVHGRCMPNPIRLRAIAKALAVDVRELILTADPDVQVKEGKMRMSSIGDGRMLIEIERSVALDTATKIMELITNDTRAVR